MNAGDVISYLEMCREEGVNLQRGMNFRLKNEYSVILMSVRPGAPYADRVEDNGRVLIYEGHDTAKYVGGPDPKKVDQPASYASGRPTQNGLFYGAAKRYQRGEVGPEVVKVYEKIRNGIWAYSGLFQLVDAWRETSKRRKVFKFKLELREDITPTSAQLPDLEPDRVIPTAVKLEVWKRDRGRCVLCGSADHLHFDHIIPYSKGGSSRDLKNIQILCARHNIAKKDKIE